MANNQMKDTAHFWLFRLKFRCSRLSIHVKFTHRDGFYERISVKQKIYSRILLLFIFQCTLTTFFRSDIIIHLYKLCITILISTTISNNQELMEVKEQEMKCDSPIVCPQRILKEEEEFTTPKQSPKKILEKQEVKFEDPELIKKMHKKEKKIETFKYTRKKVREKKKSQYPKLIGENFRPQRQIINGSQAKHEANLYCQQRNMKQLRMKTKIMIRQHSKRCKREQFLRNLHLGQAIKSEDIQLYEPEMSQQSQDIILSEEQEKMFQKIQDFYETTRKQLYSKNYSLQEVIQHLPQLRKNYNVTFLKMKKITRIATIGLIINQAYKIQIQKELTQADKKDFEKQLFALDKKQQEINQRIERHFPGQKDSIYKDLLPSRLYQIYRKHNEQKMSFQQKPAEVHILKMQ